METKPIDWSAHDKFSEDTCTCLCGAVFRSHSKFVYGPVAHIQSRQPCPSCGGHEIRQSSSDPEQQVIH